MTTYLIHNTARSPKTRGVRSGNATHRGLKQHVLGSQRRLVRGRPVSLTEDELLVHLEELQGKAKVGLLEVRTSDGRLVDLDKVSPQAGCSKCRELNEPCSVEHFVAAGYKAEDFDAFIANLREERAADEAERQKASSEPEPSPLADATAPAVVTPPLPNPPLDSAARDTPAGENMPIFPDGPVRDRGGEQPPAPEPTAASLADLPDASEVELEHKDEPAPTGKRRSRK
jgi:hypothetical protein